MIQFPEDTREGGKKIQRKEIKIKEKENFCFSIERMRKEGLFRFYYYYYDYYYYYWF
jgi:hypothetical protein